MKNYKDLNAVGVFFILTLRALCNESHGGGGSSTTSQDDGNRSYSAPAPAQLREEAVRAQEAKESGERRKEISTKIFNLEIEKKNLKMEWERATLRMKKIVSQPLDFSHDSLRIIDRYAVWAR